MHVHVVEDTLCGGAHMQGVNNVIQESLVWLLEVVKRVDWSHVHSLPQLSYNYFNMAKIPHS